MSATKNNTVCTDCNRAAVVEVLVPNIHVITHEVGAEWTPLCRAHYPTGEQWDTLLLPGQRTLSNAQWMQRTTGHNGIMTEEEAVAILESRD